MVNQNETYDERIPKPPVVCIMKFSPIEAFCKEEGLGLVPTQAWSPSGSTHLRDCGK